MMERCSHCGQIMPPKGIPDGVKLSPLHGLIWEAVTTWPGMSAMDIMNWVYGHRPDGGPEDTKNIHVNINKMNHKLREHGLEISAVGRDGYSVKYLAPEAA